MSRKILLLGGSRYAFPIIEAAHKIGCKVITCDYMPENIAHKYSDGYENVNIADKEAVLDTAARLKIDGIMSFACDPGVVSTAYAAEKLGLPSCGSYEAVSILQNKKYFRRFLLENGFHVPKLYEFKFADEAIERESEFRFPVIIKPVDSAGSKGVTKVSAADELKPALKYALDHSIKKEFIIEEFLECKGHPSDSECFSVNGELQFVSFSAQRFDRGCGNPYAPVGFTWSPTISKEHQAMIASELQRLLELLNMKTSLYNVEAREAADGRAYIMEVSPRGGGNRLAEMIRYAAGVDLIERSVKAALGDPIDKIPEYKLDDSWAEIILHSRKKGRYKGLSISDELKNSIVEIDLWVNKGDIIDDFSGANKAVGTLVLKFDNKELMAKVMAKPSAYVSVELE